MSRFLLDDLTLGEISKKVPDQPDLDKAVLTVCAPDFLSPKFPRESNIPLAAVCLKDTNETLFEARYALFEFFAHQVWYLEKCDPPNKVLATRIGRFYVDDVALRLYSAGEHLANTIIFMLEIDEQRLARYKGSRISQQLIIGNFLAKEEPQHPITKAILTLVGSKEWHQTITYRNKLVHEQPPTVAGLGVVYKRGNRWQRSETGKSYKLGLGGDKPEYSVDDLVAFVQPALSCFTNTFKAIVQFYIEMLTAHGITITPDKSQMQVKF